MKTKYLLLIIDMQNDFCLPEGALYVPGAEQDTANLAGFIDANPKKLGSIILTQDTHNVVDISHPTFWKNNQGEHPAPYTNISYDDVQSGKWKPIFSPNMATRYIQALEKQNEFPHTLWPEHCIVGSAGAAIESRVMEAVKNWARQGNFFQVIPKGLHPLTEHFGALRANIPMVSAPETQLNQPLAETLYKHENIIIAGEAKSHCVANTIKQILELENFNNQLYILEDCMSNVTGFGDIAKPIYEQAIKEGAIFTDTKILQL